jgi:protein-S-isoprenylcysteine O-methyltransferase Ste14
MFRWIALIVFAACLATSAYHRRRARRNAGTIPRTDEDPRLIAGRLVVAIPLFGGILAYLANPSWMAWSSFGLPAWARWIGVALGGLAVPAVYWVLTNLGANVSETVLTKNQHRLVTTGPYRWIRHPLYTTGLVLFFGLGLIAASWFVLLWSVIAWLGIRLVVIPREEAHLVTAFGDEYLRYRRGTGALLPSIGRR